jgi:hypothetical protein
MLSQRFCELIEEGKFAEIAQLISEMIMEQNFKLDYEHAQAMKLAIYGREGANYEATWENLYTFYKNVVQMKKVYPQAFYLSFMLFECSMWSELNYRMRDSIDSLEKDYKMQVPATAEHRMLIHFSRAVAAIENPFKIDPIEEDSHDDIERYVNSLRELDICIHYGRQHSTKLSHLMVLAEHFCVEIKRALVFSEELQYVDPGLYYLAVNNEDIDITEVLERAKQFPNRRNLYNAGQRKMLIDPGSLRIDKRIVQPQHTPQQAASIPNMVHQMQPPMSGVPAGQPPGSMAAGPYSGFNVPSS